MHPTLALAHCSRCGSHTFPATAYGCRRCGADLAALSQVPCPQAPRLLNFVTVHAELAPGLPVPCVIGEIELAPGLVEEGLINAAEDELRPEMELVAQATKSEAGLSWTFSPVGGTR